MVGMNRSGPSIFDLAICSGRQHGGGTASGLACCLATRHLNSNQNNFITK
jgi:hypothetical protein